MSRLDEKVAIITGGPVGAASMRRSDRTTEGPPTLGFTRRRSVGAALGSNDMAVAGRL